MSEGPKRSTKQQTVAEVDQRACNRRKEAQDAEVWDKWRHVKATQRGSPVSVAIWTILARIYSVLRAEKAEGRPVPLGSVWVRVTQYTGVSQSTLSKLQLAVETTGELPVQEKRTPRPAPVVTMLNQKQLLVLRRWVLNCAKRGYPVSVAKIRAKVEEKFAALIKDTSMRRILKETLGLQFKTIRSHGTLVETDRILNLVKSYLQELNKVRADKTFTLVFTDESYIHPNYAVSRTWMEANDTDQTFGSPKGKGRRIIIIHYGSEEGWIEGAKKVWVCTGKETGSTDDYHGNVNGKVWLQHFEKVCQLLHAKGKKAVFCMDNAKYHKVADEDPLRTLLFEGRALHEAKVEHLRAYLNYFKIPFDPLLLRPALLKLVREKYQAPPPQSFAVASKYGHRILFTPPYWPQLQPIENVWGIVKRYVADHRHAGDYTVEATVPLLDAGFASVTPEIWEKTIVHAIEEGDRLLEQVDPEDPPTLQKILYVGAPQGDVEEDEGDQFSEESDDEEEFTDEE